LKDILKGHLIAPDWCHKALLKVGEEAGDIAKVVQNMCKVGNLHTVGGQKDGRIVGVKRCAEPCPSSGKAAKDAAIGGHMKDALERVNRDIEE
jgi:hypothetical protein